MSKKQTIRSAVIEAITGEFAIWAIIGFFAMMTIMACCATWRLPDRSKCTVPWEERKDCIDNTQCAPAELCAHRGEPIGKCTLLDCCNPWRQGPRLLDGYDWCEELDKQPETRYTD